MSPRRLAAEVDAYRKQSAAVADWVDGLSFDLPTALPDWTVRTLVGHLVGSKDGLAEYLTTTAAGPATPVGDYVRAYATAARNITAASSAAAGDRTPQQLLARLRDPVRAPDIGDTALVAGPRGAITALDFARTRVVDLVVHCDDLSRSFRDRDPVPLLRPALATAVRTLAEILAAQAPGRSVEVRIAPFIAVQAVPGPRHTRGTPPNVVETDPVTWLRIATGREPFAAAVARGAVRASGNRSDLTDHLPVLA
jgi:uncharacterized protein (TIGR03083 family)